MVQALRLVVEGFPVYAAAQATQVSSSLLFRKLARHKDLPSPAKRAAAVLQVYWKLHEG